MNRSPDVKSSLVLNHLNTRNKSKPFSVNANRLHIGQFFPLSWAQQRLWFLEQLEDLGAAYHIPAVLRLQGELDREALQRTLDEILARHEVLRTVFVRKENGEPVQRILPEQPFALAYHDLSQLAEAEKEQARASLTEETLHRPFDLTQDILIRASLAKLGEQDHVLNLCMHHIVSDGWSMGVLTRELAALYGAFSQGQENPLPALPIQYTVSPRGFCAGITGSLW